jgi:outer membrane receptor for ferrienterochelin and colicins
VITKRPEIEQTTMGAKLGWISGIPDRTASVTTTLLSDDGKLGSFFFAQTRDRNPADLNSDGFSELGMLESGTFGTQVFYTPKQNLDFTFEMHYLKENRRGGDRVTSSRPHEAVVAEAIESNRIGGGLNLNHRVNAWTDYTLYTSVALTNRDTYYGGASPEFMDDGSLLMNPDLNAYGQTRNPMLCAGGQLNHRFNLDNILTAGVEWSRDHLMDHILSYNLLTDNVYQSFGVYGQHDWQANSRLNLVFGARLEKHSEIDGPIVSPRVSALCRLNEFTALRGSFSTGFRPPMVFDEDLHITQIGGEGQIIVNDPDLDPEKSYSFSGGIEFNRSSNKDRNLFVSLSGFHTQLKDAFSVQFDRIEGTALINRRVNAGGARVYGAEIEVTARPADFLSLRGGWTVQRSEYDDEIDISFDEANPIITRRFLRTPDLYGYLSATWELFEDKIDLETSLDITGPMSVINAETNAYRDRTEWFGVFDVKLSRRFGDKRYWKIFVQGHNLFDSRQDDLDRVVLSGDPSRFHLRDAGYVYGPDRPRSFYTGIEMGF